MIEVTVKKGAEVSEVTALDVESAFMAARTLADEMPNVGRLFVRFIAPNGDEHTTTRRSDLG